MATATEEIEEHRRRGHVVAARFDRRRRTVCLRLHNGASFSFPVHLAEGLRGASAAKLAEIEISPSGLGLHWPQLDADLYVPALLQGIFGSTD